MTRGALIAAALLVAAAAGAGAQGMGGGTQMPDPRMMSGRPLPVEDLPVGTVTVRVARGSVGNVIPNQAVEISGGAAPRTVKTNDSGRAEFSGLQPGTRVKFTATVDGERLESEEFAVPASGGTRVALIATDPGMEKRAAEDRARAQGPSVPGLVVLSEQSRFVIEMGDEALNVFNILEIVNTARVPVQPPSALVFELPPAARAPGLLEGSSPQATMSGHRLTIAGPFAPGNTLVQFAYSLPFAGPDLVLEQKLPAGLSQLNVMAQKVGAMELHSPQIAAHVDRTVDGQTYTVARGPALNAGDTLVLNFKGLPHQPSWPRNLALALAVLILAGGAWGTIRGGTARPAEDARRRKLEARRERLFSELASVEEQHRDGTIDPDRYPARRRELVAALERVYAEMDEDVAA